MMDQLSLTTWGQFIWIAIAICCLCGKYYPINVSKPAASKGAERPLLNCPDDSVPDWSSTADTYSKRYTTKVSEPYGNRVRYVSGCGTKVRDADNKLVYPYREWEVTNTCLPKCPNPGTTFVPTYHTKKPPEVFFGRLRGNLIICGFAKKWGCPNHRCWRRVAPVWNLRRNANLMTRQWIR